MKKHDAVISAVLERKIDVGACLEGVLKAWKDQKGIKDQIGFIGFLPVTNEELNPVRNILTSVKNIMKK